MLWKYCKNIVNVILFFFKFLSRFRQPQFFFSSHFRQWHCHNWQKKNFTYFGNAIATIGLSQIFFELIITDYVWFIVKMLKKYCGQDTFFFLLYPKFRNHFFPPIFGNGIAIISLSTFFFLFTLGTPRTPLTPGQQNWAKEFRYPRCRNSTFSLSTFFFSLSYFWLNFGNDNTEIQSLSSKSQISFNSFYNTN